MTPGFSFAPWFLSIVILVVDFITKRVVLDRIDILLAKVNVIGDFVRFTYVRNPGAAMGLFPSNRIVLIVVSIVASVLFSVFYFHTSPTEKVRRCAIAAIVGGAVGNLVDRIFYDGLVVDFIDLGIGTHRFYTFNVADMGVTIGGTLLFLSLWLESRRLSGEASE